MLKKLKMFVKFADLVFTLFIWGVFFIPFVTIISVPLLIIFKDFNMNILGALSAVLAALAAGIVVYALKNHSRRVAKETMKPIETALGNKIQEMENELERRKNAV